MPSITDSSGVDLAAPTAGLAMHSGEVQGKRRLMLGEEVSTAERQRGVCALTFIPGRACVLRLPHGVGVLDQKSFCLFARAEISNVRNSAFLVSARSYDSHGGVRWNGTPAKPNNPSHVAFVSAVCDPGSLRQEQPTGSEASKAPSHCSTDKRLCSRTRAYKVTADTPLLCCPWIVSLKFSQYLTLNTFERVGGGVE